MPLESRAETHRKSANVAVRGNRRVYLTKSHRRMKPKRLFFLIHPIPSIVAREEQEMNLDLIWNKFMALSRDQKDVHNLKDIPDQ